VEPLADADSEDDADNSHSDSDAPVEDIVDGQRGPGDEGCDGAATDSDSEREEDPNGVDEAAVTATAMGGLVEVAGVTWKRVAPSTVHSTRTREEPGMVLRNITVDANTTELDIHDALLPVSMEFLHDVVSFRAEEANDNRTHTIAHLRAFLVCLYGGAQFKEGTELWAETAFGVMPAPRFGRRLNKDRFERMLRCMARGPGGCEDPKTLGFPFAILSAGTTSAAGGRFNSVGPSSLTNQCFLGGALVALEACLTSLTHRESRRIWELN